MAQLRREELLRTSSLASALAASTRRRSKASACNAAYTPMRMRAFGEDSAIRVALLLEKRSTYNSRCATTTQGKGRASLRPSERLISLTRRDGAGSTGGNGLRHAPSAQEAFLPAISARSRALPARSLSELSDGGRLRRERTLVRAFSWRSDVLVVILTIALKTLKPYSKGQLCIPLSVQPVDSTSV